jgi:hypothetical protein
MAAWIDGGTLNATVSHDRGSASKSLNASVPW